MPMSYDQYERTMQEKRERRLLDQHIDKVKERLHRDDLSALELQELRAQKLAESYDAQGGMRQRLEAEVAVLDEMVAIINPEPTIEEQIASMREHGLRDAADGLEHSLQTIRARDDVQRLESQLYDPDLPGYQRTGIEHALQAARETLEKLNAYHPVHAREAKVKELRGEAEAITEQLRTFEPRTDASKRLHNELSQRREAALQQAQGIEDGALDLTSGDAA